MAAIKKYFAYIYLDGLKHELIGILADSNIIM